jgi:hypothetical protein
MNQSAKCPGCSQTVAKIVIKAMPAQHNFDPPKDGVVYCCPHCNVILGAAIDPVLLANQIIAAIKR